MSAARDGRSWVMHPSSPLTGPCATRPRQAPLGQQASRASTRNGPVISPELRPGPWVARAHPRYARFPGQKGGGVMTRVTEHLKTHGVPYAPITHQQAYTSIAEARALGIDASEVLKTVAVRGAGGYALMAIPATCRLDMHLVQAAVFFF